MRSTYEPCARGKGLTRPRIHAVIKEMELTREQRRALIAMCCVVARSDGDVGPSEYETLLDLMSRLAKGAVGFSELEAWMHADPPIVTARLPEESIRMFLREALTLARADGKLEQVEISTIKDLVARYFEAPTG